MTASKKMGISIMSFLHWTLHGGKGKEQQYHILFGPQTVGKGWHGQIMGTWQRNTGNTEVAIPFYVDGFQRAPRLDLRLMEEIYYQAGMQGIRVSHLYSYDGLISKQKM